VQDLERIFDTITVCIILHNFLVQQGECLSAASCAQYRGATPIGPIQMVLNEATMLQVPVVVDKSLVDPTNMEGRQFREAVVPRVLASGRGQEAW
jgi:hypothetical protein